jgi:hypothetical protein
MFGARPGGARSYVCIALTMTVFEGLGFSTICVEH